jgi:hypothetical protein
MENMQRGWKKDEFSSPDIIWLIDLNGQVVEVVKGEPRIINVGGASVKLVYLYLVRCLDIDQRVMPSHKTIAKWTQLGVSTVKRCLRVLADYGLIEIINRFKEGSKENDTNYYIIHHPSQVAGLKYLEVQQSADVSMFPGQSTMNQRQSTMNQRQSTMNQRQSTMNQGGQSTMNQKDISSSSSYISSVVKTPDEEDFKKLNEAWKKCFNQNVDKAAYTTFIKYAEVDFVIDIVDKIKEHHKAPIDSPFGFVFSCIRKGGYIVEESKEPEKKKKVTKINKKERKLRGEKVVPEALRSESGESEPLSISSEEEQRLKKKIEEKIRILESRAK